MISSNLRPAAYFKHSLFVIYGILHIVPSCSRRQCAQESKPFSSIGPSLRCSPWRFRVSPSALFHRFHLSPFPFGRTQDSVFQSTDECHYGWTLVFLHFQSPRFPGSTPRQHTCCILFGDTICRSNTRRQDITSLRHR
jgi:hypothetical protein